MEFSPLGGLNWLQDVNVLTYDFVVLRIYTTRQIINDSVKVNIWETNNSNVKLKEENL